MENLFIKEINEYPWDNEKSALIKNAASAELICEKDAWNHHNTNLSEYERNKEFCQIILQTFILNDNSDNYRITIHNITKEIIPYAFRPSINVDMKDTYEETIAEIEHKFNKLVAENKILADAITRTDITWDMVTVT